MAAIPNKMFTHKRKLALHDCELGRREIMDIE